MKTYNRYFRTNIDFVHHNFSESENLSNASKLLKAAILGYYALAVAKSAAEPGNSNLTKGEQHAQRAFFVRSTRTPKERLETLRGSERHSIPRNLVAQFERLKFHLNELGMPKFGHTQILSMVACNGKGSPFADFLWCQFSSLLHVTAQTLESLAVALINQPKDTVMKRFKFLTGSRLIITIYANNRQEAENKIKWANKPICIGLNLPSIQGGAVCVINKNNSTKAFLNAGKQQSFYKQCQNHAFKKWTA